MVTYEYHVLHCSGNIFKPFFPNVSTIFRILKHVYSENKINSAHEKRTYACILEGRNLFQLWTSTEAKTLGMVLKF